MALVYFALALLGLLILAVIAIVIIASMKPGSFRIQRSANIDASPDRIFAFVNDLHLHRDWNPFDQDPSLQRTYSGAPSGKGAAYNWEGNRKVGKGRIEITDASAPSAITMSLKMVSPFKCNNRVEFTFVPQGGATNVNWAMSGPQPFMAKVMSTIMDCDKMMGGEFEKGLAKLKSLAEAPDPLIAKAS
ncbi:MAG TPA: SRPBCC family protein [Xanthobacteraceae bacterium]|nr:SRPBCC family protein [Xanthobacteraceae bacterium]